MLIEVTSQAPMVNYQNQTQFPIHVVCASNTATGIIAETNTTFACNGSNSDAIVNLDLHTKVDGNLTLTAQFSDGSSVLSSAIIKDTVAPDISTLVPSFASTSNLYSSPTIIYSTSATESGSGLYYYEVRIKNSTTQAVFLDWRKIASGSHFSITSPYLTSGQQYYFEIRATDNAGNLSQTQQYAAWTAQGPVIAITNPASNGAVVDSTNVFSYPISGTCNNEGGAITISVTDVSSVTLTASTTCHSNVWSVLMDFTQTPGPLSLGTLTVIATFKDIVNNVATPANRTLTKQ